MLALADASPEGGDEEAVRQYQRVLDTFERLGDQVGLATVMLRLRIPQAANSLRRLAAYRRELSVGPFTSLLPTTPTWSRPSHLCSIRSTALKPVRLDCPAPDTAVGARAGDHYRLAATGGLVGAGEPGRLG